MKPVSLPVFVLSLAILASCSPSSDEDAPVADAVRSNVPARVAVADAWCRPSPNGARAGGCYAILVAMTDDRLLGGSTPRAGQLQIHEMTIDGGMMKMGELKDGLILPAGRPVPLAPGGDHMMLIGLTQPLALGETVPLTLRFAQAPEVTIEAQVRNPASAPTQGPAAP